MWKTYLVETVRHNRHSLDYEGIILATTQMGTNFQKQPSGGNLRKRCYKNMQESNRRTPMSKCNFNN